MANITDRTPENVSGTFYVDSTCIDCGICRAAAPEFFRRFDDGGYSVVHRQPRTNEEFDLAMEALESFPSMSIGSDGPEPLAPSGGVNGEAQVTRSECIVLG